MKEEGYRKTINSVVKRDMCVSCGACSAGCPVGAIELVYCEAVGMYKPTISYEKCVKCEVCKSVCPVENRVYTKDLIGKYEKLFLAHANCKNVRIDATSGGVINSLVQYLLEANIVEGVLMVGYDSDSIIETSVRLLTKKDVDRLRKSARDYASRYVVYPILVNIKKLADRYEKLAIVGTPCQIQALNLLEKKLKNKFILKIGIACSGGMSYIATEQYKHMENMTDAKIFYRGNGWPGKNTLISKDRIVEYSHLDSLYGRMFSSQIFKNRGCFYCSDHFAEMADISFCDFWDTDELKTECIGNSCVIIRNTYANKIFENLVNQRYVNVVRTLEKEEIINAQLSILKAKKGKLRKNPLYKLYMLIIKIIFDKKYYVYLRDNEYKILVAIYHRICDAAKFNSEKM